TAAAVAIAETIPATEAVTTARRAPIITPVAGAARKRVETFLPETVPLVAPPAATSFIVTHEPNAPSLRFLSPGGGASEVELPQVLGDIAYKKSLCERFKKYRARPPRMRAHRVESLRRFAGRV